MTETSIHCDRKRSLVVELTAIYDEFSQFTDHCSFLCDAYAAIIAQEDAIEASTARGFHSSTCWLKKQAEGIKIRLKEVQQRAREEQEKKESQ